MTTPDNQPPVIVTREGGVIQLAINAPQSRNSLQAPGVLEDRKSVG